MNQTLPSANNEALNELSNEQCAAVGGGMSDQTAGSRPVQERVPGRLTPDPDEQDTMAGAMMGW